MDFKQIEAFVNVVKYKSFSKAADASFLTQPTISMHISILEKELNMQLINRQSKEALPTKEGRTFYKYALMMLNTREKAVYSLNKQPSNVSGILEIQASSIPGEYIVPGLMAKFKQIYPGVKFYLEESDSVTVSKNLLENKGEIGFTGMKGENGLTYIPLMRDEAVMITPLSAKFKALAGKALKLEEFIEEPFILREQGSGTRKEFENNLEKLGYHPGKLDIIARMNSMESIKNAVASGLGVSIVSKIAVGKECDKDRFLIFGLEEYHLNREFYIVYNKKVTLSPRAEVFKGFVLNCFDPAEL
jgi:Transcriptional regulator